ncbi:PadR family transcriptional regulator [Bryobacter aggregatus]|uniref:PadR family transcriptional regulator n=1 Tax=Bryobacter aggregatus TaxID=360054 RepID=UPI0004E11C6B|nr:PadR family transcriptional regulator [Bryobacter aggregatus]
MPKSRNDKLQGTLTLLVLRTLKSRGSLHGYGICEHISRVSGDLLQLEEGSLYPALHRMEQDGWISSQWEITDKGRKAKFYTMSPRGEEQLADENETWSRLARGVTRVLRYS